MNKKIALLRGINVGGHKKILMADLRQMFEQLGFENVKTYIQSGNVIFDLPKDAPENMDEAEIENKIEAAIQTKFAFDVPVIVRSRAALEALVNQNPFIEEDQFDESQLLLTCLKLKPEAEHKSNTESFQFEPDRYIIVEKDIYMLCMGKYHLSKLSNNFFESKLKVGATTRAWKTIVKLLELSQ